MPRPQSLDGKNENVTVKVSKPLLAEIDAARGPRSRSDWGRDAFLVALRRPAPPPAPQQPAAPAPVLFREPEPEPKNCKHPHVRGKGVCPDCHEWVASKP